MNIPHSRCPMCGDEMVPWYLGGPDQCPACGCVDAATDMCFAKTGKSFAEVKNAAVESLGPAWVVLPHSEGMGGFEIVHLGEQPEACSLAQLRQLGDMLGTDRIRIWPGLRIRIFGVPQ